MHLKHLSGDWKRGALGQLLGCERQVAVSLIPLLHVINSPTTVAPSLSLCLDSNIHIPETENPAGPDILPWARSAEFCSEFITTESPSHSTGAVPRGGEILS